MIRIIIKNPPSAIPLFMSDFDGLYSLDLEVNSRIALTKQIDDYIDVGKIKQDTFKQVDLKVSKKNKLLLGKVGNPLKLNQNNSEVFDIIILKGDYSYPAQGLQVIESSDTSISIIIIGELNAWIKPMSELYLNNLDLGSAVVDFAYLSNLHSLHAEYEDGNAPVFPPLVNYGKWFINSNLNENTGATAQVVFNNYRFWHSPLAVLRQAFCQVGHRLISPFMETEGFRKHWMYLLDPNFETEMQLDIANRPFEAEVISDFNFAVLFNVNSSGGTLGGIAIFANSISDPGGHTSLTIPSGAPSDPYHGFFYSGGIVGTFDFKGTVRINIPSGPLTPASPEFITLKASIRKAPKFGINNQQELIEQSTELISFTNVKKGTLISGVNYDFTYNLSTSLEKVYQHELVFVLFEYDAFLFGIGGQTYTESFLYQHTDLLVGSSFKCNVQKQVIEEGDTIEFGKLLRKDLTALDVFKGLAHIPNAKVESNTISKEVSLFPEYPIDYFSAGIQEGYFKSNIEDVFDATKKIQAKSLKATFKNTDLARNVYLKFKTSSDGYILNENLEQELHSKKIDLGPNYIEGINEISNPLFEPLANGIESKTSGLEITIAPGDVRLSANYMPIMWEGSPASESEYPKVGYNFSPRIAIAYREPVGIFLQPELTGAELDTNASFIYEDQVYTTYNPFGQIFPQGIFMNQSPGQSPALNLTVVYGNGINVNYKDYWQFIYEKSVKQAYFAIALNFLVLLDLVDFSNLSFRRKWRLKYDSANWGEIEIYCRLSLVSDYLIDENLTTPVELIPDNNNFIC